VCRLAAITLVVVLGLASVQASEIGEDTWEKLHRYNLMTQCWGEDAMAALDIKLMTAMEKCAGPKPPVSAVNLPMPLAPRQAMMRSPMNTIYYPAYHQYNPFVSQGLYGRRKRGAEGDLMPTKEDEMRFLGKMSDFKGMMETKMGNLSCVLQECGILDAAGNINSDMLTYDAVKEMYGNTKAGSDPAFLMKYANEMKDCLDVSNSWPQSALNRNPWMAVHGRHMIFFSCVKRCEDNMCAKYLMQQHLERMYGSGPTKPGMPEDKYDAAAMAVKVMMETATPEEKFMDKFFWGKPMM